MTIFPWSYDSVLYTKHINCIFNQERRLCFFKNDAAVCLLLHYLTEFWRYATFERLQHPACNSYIHGTWLLVDTIYIADKNLTTLRPIPKKKKWPLFFTSNESLIVTKKWMHRSVGIFYVFFSLAANSTVIRYGGKETLIRHKSVFTVIWLNLFYN